MTSEVPRHDGCFVWTWLPDATEPVVAGRLTARDGLVTFTYGRSYLGTPGALPLYEAELPLRPGEQRPLPGLAIAGAIRDAAPDAWGRRVILNRKFGLRAADLHAVDLSEITFLLESGSDRVGNLDFQVSADTYVPRQANNASLEELLQSADRVEQGIPLTPELDRALQHGSSIGGARPKALINDGDRKFVAKFSASNDTYSVVKAEFLAMRLAAHAGINVAQVELVRASGKDVLLVERFDRVRAKGGWRRRAMVSALTMLELDEMHAPYASYEDLAEKVRHHFDDAPETLRELFRRILFNILCGNTDDHARNHAAFWDGSRLSLTPAYDICPQGRTGGEASQAMLVDGSDRRSRVQTAVGAARHFLLKEDEAVGIAVQQIEAIGARWGDVCAEADIGQVDRALFANRQFLNPYAFQALEPKYEHLALLAEQVRATIRPAPVEGLVG
jgi:serine/threonine-protein kinase HipA